MDPDEPERTQSTRFAVTLMKMTADKKTRLSGAVGGDSPVCFNRFHKRKIRGSGCLTRCLRYLLPALRSCDNPSV